MLNPEGQIRRLKNEFEQAKAEIWADPDTPLADKGPAVEQLWREFNQQRQELRSAYEGEATGEEHPSPGPSPKLIFPRRRKPLWK